MGMKSSFVLRIVFHHFSRVANEHAQSHWVLQGAPSSRLPSTQLLYHLRHSHPILLPDEVQETEGMVLRDVAR